MLLRPAKPSLPKQGEEAHGSRVAAMDGEEPGLLQHPQQNWLNQDDQLDGPREKALDSFLPHSATQGASDPGPADHCCAPSPWTVRHCTFPGQQGLHAPAPWRPQPEAQP